MKNEYIVFPHPSLDWRLSPDRHTNVRMPAKHFTSVEAVEKRREELTFSLRMAAGLYPWPEKTPLNVRKEDKFVTRGEFNRHVEDNARDHENMFARLNANDKLTSRLEGIFEGIREDLAAIKNKLFRSK